MNQASATTAPRAATIPGRRPGRRSAPLDEPMLARDVQSVVPARMKTVHAILCFHAHEPLWDLPRRLQRSSRDRRVRHAIVPESYIRRRMREGRNVYRDLIGFAVRRGVTVAIDATNELLFQLRQSAPGTYRELGRAYRRK